VSTQIIGCTLCGWVARPEMFEDGKPVCLDCGGPLQEMDIGHARHLVGARRRADERRRAAQNAAEVGLSPTGLGGDAESE
jgi:hypothetical protein